MGERLDSQSKRNLYTGLGIVAGAAIWVGGMAEMAIHDDWPKPVIGAIGAVAVIGAPEALNQISKLGRRQ